MITMFFKFLDHGVFHICMTMKKINLIIVLYHVCFLAIVISIKDIFDEKTFPLKNLEELFSITLMDTNVTSMTSGF